MQQRNYLHIFLAVEKALFLRELNMQFSSSKLGVFWTFFQPFMQVISFIIIKSLILGRGSETFDYAVFLALNFTAFNMFSGILNKSIGAFDANKGLFNYKQVKPIDTILARVLVEVFMATILYSIFLFIGYYFDFGMEGKNILMVGVGLIWLALFSFSFGLVVAIGNVFHKSIGKTVKIFTFGLMIFSAVFYPLEAIPPAGQAILVYNPLANFMEIIHGFYFYSLDDRFVDYNYIGIWTILLLYVGMWLYVRLEKKIISK